MANKQIRVTKEEEKIVRLMRSLEIKPQEVMEWLVRKAAGSSPDTGERKTVDWTKSFAR